MNARFDPVQNDSNGWFALSDRGLLEPGLDGLMLQRGSFVMEVSLPLPSSEILMDFQSVHGWARTFSIFHDSEIGIVMLHRQGDSVVRHVLPGPLPMGRGTGRLTFNFDAPARKWTMVFEVLGGENATQRSSFGANPLPFNSYDLSVICESCKPFGSVLWYGFMQDRQLPRAAPWIGLRTPIETSLGRVFAGNLKPGDMIMTYDRGPVQLRAVTPLFLPARGSFCPVLLRAPYFGKSHDLLVSADQPIVIGGLETEYLFDQDSVLVPAASLVDGRTAFSDTRRAVTGTVALDLGMPALIEADSCLLGIGHDAEAEYPMRSLKNHEVRSLMSLLGRCPRRSA